ncbi:hypothetical protein H257_14013 [Aphanomyces astaci]|uniref:Myb-like domain-containing protein n=1 Tax=Aphanomyces astaci TaxID=112090 RepID=W4FUH4_APHAT|nr:hypothetical protein H257_14013 [Aphanomyces astaci]ETV70313.1 hypothetical protein H257_14013 [Aphanomyces astaci]|eukprot:XP_009840025.1 hypothetical protein H257_14013 [Aphanomyces astaci]
MTTASKRRFTEEEDVMLLREVNARMPFRARRGAVMDAWAEVAAALLSHEDFDRSVFDAKRAHNRFTLLLEGHRGDNRESMRASGVDEEYSEKMQLLDELLSTYDDNKAEKRGRLEEAQREADRIESLGKTVREEALQSLGKRRLAQDGEGSSGGGGGKLFKIMSMIQDDNKAKLEIRKLQYEKDLEERQKDRDVLIEQSRMQHEAMMNILAALNKTK